jgi:hypothetical protein
VGRDFQVRTNISNRTCYFWTIENRNISRSCPTLSLAVPAVPQQWGGRRNAVRVSSRRQVVVAEHDGGVDGMTQRRVVVEDDGGNTELRIGCCRGCGEAEGRLRTMGNGRRPN